MCGVIDSPDSGHWMGLCANVPLLLSRWNSSFWVKSSFFIQITFPFSNYVTLSENFATGQLIGKKKSKFRSMLGTVASLVTW